MRTITSPGRIPALAAGRLQHASNDDTTGRLHTEGFGQLGAEIVGFHANPTARDAAISNNAFEHLLGNRSGNGKPRPCFRRIGVDGGVDTQQVALDVDQCTAGVAWIDGGVLSG